MKIHTKFDIENYLNKEGRAVAHFYYDSKEPLKDYNNKYCTVDNTVSASKDFKSTYVNSIFNDHAFFIPYSELHLPSGSFSLRYSVTIFTKDSNEDYVQSASTALYQFNLNNSKEATSESNVNSKIKVNNVQTWQEHNVYETIDGVQQKGMKIHTKFDIENYLNKEGIAVAYFYSESKEPLKDHNKKFNDISGNVAAYKDFKPTYINTTYNDLAVFIPYSELHLPSGSFSLKYNVSIFTKDSNGEYVQSAYATWMPFTINNQ